MYALVNSILVFVLSTLLMALPASAATKPNIVLVFMDNFGWGEPGFNGGGLFAERQHLASIPWLPKVYASPTSMSNPSALRHGRQL